LQYIQTVQNLDGNHPQNQRPGGLVAPQLVWSVDGGFPSLSNPTTNISSF